MKRMKKKAKRWKNWGQRSLHRQARAKRAIKHSMSTKCLLDSELMKFHHTASKDQSVKSCMTSTSRSRSSKTLWKTLQKFWLPVWVTMRDCWISLRYARVMQMKKRSLTSKSGSIIMLLRTSSLCCNHALRRILSLTLSHTGITLSETLDSWTMVIIRLQTSTCSSVKLHLIILNLMEFESRMEASVDINSSRSVWKCLSSFTPPVTCIVQVEGWKSSTPLTRKITKKSQFRGLSSYLLKICSSPTTIKSEEISQISERIDFGTRR